MRRRGRDARDGVALDGESNVLVRVVLDVHVVGECAIVKGPVEHLKSCQAAASGRMRLTSLFIGQKLMSLRLTTSPMRPEGDTAIGESAESWYSSGFLIIVFEGMLSAVMAVFGASLALLICVSET